ncbi:DUF5053 domain-containing protein [Bacteroides sp. 519]|uniref:DUF5053 domain-containing protein n=1 Tax=Bacteroides sp. 519 TaxID=2302937 RepID=UPI0013D24851|nr:DUF5053 domain-containing protein [Bacteroides sp. 519]NDV57902.1 DUF5053 domain-containing protein [Bacteroides sp. 519]
MENLKETIRICYEEFCLAKTEEEKQLNDIKFKELMSSVPIEQRKIAGQYLREVMRERRKEKSQKINRDIKKELEDIQEVISLSYIAKEYFGKDRTWLYKKINGPLTFTKDELKTLAIALNNIGNRFIDTSTSIT